MSNGNTAIPVSPVTDIIAALHAGEAAKARLPELETALAQQNAINEKQAYHNQRLEENILGYKNQIAELTSKVRSLEVERDDAGFHALEAEDKLAKLLGFMRNAATAMDDEIRFIDPPKPVPNVAEVLKAYEVKGESDERPTPASTQVPDAGYAPQAGVGSGPSEPSHYQPFTPPAPSSKPVEITESGPAKQDPTQSNTQPSHSESGSNVQGDMKTEPYLHWNSPAPSYR